MSLWSHRRSQVRRGHPLHNHAVMGLTHSGQLYAAFPWKQSCGADISDAPSGREGEVCARHERASPSGAQQKRASQCAEESAAPYTSGSEPLERIWQEVLDGLCEPIARGGVSGWLKIGRISRASQTTSPTPARPRATRPRRNSVQKKSACCGGFCGGLSQIDSHSLPSVRREAPSDSSGEDPALEIAAQEANVASDLQMRQAASTNRLVDLAGPDGEQP